MSTANGSLSEFCPGAARVPSGDMGGDALLLGDPPVPSGQCGFLLWAADGPPGNADGAGEMWPGGLRPSG